MRMLEMGPPVKDVLEYYSGSLRTGITYAGGVDIKTLQDEVEFIKIN